MKVNNDKAIFNLLDTNGRRNDVVNALQIYLSVLDEILNEMRLTWNPMPKSTGQYHFYEKVFKLSEGVFNKNKNYTKVINELNLKKELKEAIYSHNKEWIKENKDKYKDIFNDVDNGIEDRARHYTNCLVKLGFTDDKRNISNAGEALLGKIQVNKDCFERLLPINDINVIFLRQLLKIRIFAKDEDAYYTPFCMALYVLFVKKRLSYVEFSELVQSQSPYHLIDNLDEYIKNYKVGDYLQKYDVEVPDEINITSQLEEKVIKRYFRNGKSKKVEEQYYQFYISLYSFYKDKTKTNLDNLLNIYEEYKNAIDKAFGYGKSLFNISKGNRPSVEGFLDNFGYELFDDSINSKLYIMFVKSKRADDLREKSDTSRRIFKATGIISFDNGYVEMAYRELCELLFSVEKIKSMCMGRLSSELSSYYDNYSEYEGDKYSFLCDMDSIIYILEYSDDYIMDTLSKISSKFKEMDIDNIPALINDKRKEEFATFVGNKYPESKVKELLKLFADRKNDSRIKKFVNPDATVPTIYEYVVGLAWYYFSNKSVDILSSYNLTLSADFEPLTHAGGGAGDIVIQDNSRVIMLEATLMNANAQKRGEWEPVLRHAINLKVDEEDAETGREVTTFFIADHFDQNTINIWKAVSSVPMQSTKNKNKFTDNVIIMPINNKELIKLMDHKEKYKETLNLIKSLFVKETTNFDVKWRDRFINEIM